MQFQPAVIKHAAGQPNTIEIIKNLHKNDFDDLVADLSNNVKKRFLASLNNDKTNAVINSGYSSVSQTVLFSSLLSLSQIKSFKVGQTSPLSLS